MHDSAQSQQHGWRGVLGHFVQHMREEWPATIFVAAAFVLLDTYVGWLDAVNGHAFLAIGNIAGVPQASGERKAKALAVLIDQAAAETRYLDRSPLDRCKLEADLRTVYSAMAKHKLSLLVIDLDLSPARWLASDEGKKATEAKCEEQLHQLIAGAFDQWKVRTVLMVPIEAVDATLKEKQEAWRKDLKPPGVTFGRATLPVEYGLVIKQYCDAETLAASAYTLVLKSPKSAKNCIDDETNSSARSKRETQLIDPRKYLSGVVPIAIGGTNDFGARLGSALENGLTSRENDSQSDLRAVFFGAAFGEGDTFVTPLGELYGVEIHAAGFLSFLDPLSTENHVSEFVADIVFGFVFGFLIAWFWARYFELRLSDESLRRLSAPFVLVGLGVTVALVAFGLTLVSWGLFVLFGIWASPIPMAIGMLIESFVSGSVAEGIRVADGLKGVRKPHRQFFWESATNFFGGGFLLLLKQGQNLSAALVAFRLTVWMVVVVLGVRSVLH